MVEPSKKRTDRFFCKFKQCTQLFSNRKEHSEHKNNLYEIPDQLSSYVFIKKLGQGTYGAVFEVYDHTDDEKKAVKIIQINDSSLASDGDLHTLKKLHHQNIVHYHHSGILKECSFVVMELCDSDLETMIEKNKLTNFDEQMNVFKQICRGIEYFHDVINYMLIVCAKINNVNNVVVILYELYVNNFCSKKNLVLIAQNYGNNLKILRNNMLIP